MPTTYKKMKPCYLLNVRCSVHGGLTYRRSDEDVVTEDEREEATWTTDRVIQNRAEYNKAQALRNRIKRAIANLGVPGDLGIFCTRDSRREIDKAVRKWTVKIDKFNQEAQHSVIRFRVARWKVEGENEEVLQDMLVDLRGLVDELKVAVKNADYKSIRSVVTRLRGYDMVLPEDAADFLQRAVANAKAQAIDVRKSLEKHGEDLKQVQDRMNTSSIDFARFALMEPGSQLDDVDNELLQRRLMEAHAEERGAGILLEDAADEEGEELPSYLTATENGDSPFLLID